MKDGFTGKGLLSCEAGSNPKVSSMGWSAAVAYRASVSVTFWVASRVWRCGRGSTGLGVVMLCRSWLPVFACLVSLVQIGRGGAIAERLRGIA